jgi:hypothetical protein
MFPVFGFVLLVLVLILYLTLRQPLVLIALVYGFTFLLTPFAIPTILDTEAQDLENELDLLAIAETPTDTSREQRAEKLFKLHQFELKRYYDQTLRHSAWIFLVGISSIAVGFAIIGSTIYLVAVGLTGKGLSEQIVIAAIGAVGGVLSNFIAVIYLRMHSETIKSLAEFHNRLVVTHHLHFANFLTSKIQDQPLREKTLGEMASSLAKLEVPPVIPTKEATKEEKA